MGKTLIHCNGTVNYNKNQNTTSYFIDCSETKYQGIPTVVLELKIHRHASVLHAFIICMTINIAYNVFIAESPVSFTPVYNLTHNDK